jgi:hypothetical protein
MIQNMISISIGLVLNGTFLSQLASGGKGLNY